MTARRLTALALCSGLVAGPPSAQAASREVDPRRVENAALAIRAARRQILQRDADRDKRLAILKAERVAALRLNQRGRADALALTIQLAQQQGRVQAAQDREGLRAAQTTLRLALRGEPAE